MSDKKPPIDRDRFFSDPEYRKQVREKQQAAGSKKVVKGGTNGGIDVGGNENVREGSTKGVNKRFNGKSTTDISLQTAKKTIVRYFIAALLLITLSLSLYVRHLFEGLPSIQELENPETAIASTVVSRDGVVLDRYFVENRTYVPISEISPTIVNALVATEDHRFFTHWGLDMERIIALPYYWIQGQIQGGSTLSQQLARNLYRKIGREVSVTRKLKEMITAIQIEQNYTKREIIEMYLNTVEFANSAFGIESAAQTHYSKPASDVTITEAATLVGQLQAIYAYNPRLFPERSARRRNIVLSLMMKRGFISEATFDHLKNEPIVLQYNPPSKSGRESRYFGEYVRQTVTEWTRENGYNLYTDGLKIYTTIDSRLQSYAERAVKERLAEFQTTFQEEWTSPDGSYMDKLWETYPEFLRSFIRETDEYKNGFSEYGVTTERELFEILEADSAFIDGVMRDRTRLQASFLAVDPVSAHVLAWVGGVDYGQQQFDHVYQARRQAGSTFKPFVYAVAIDNGYMPYHRFSKYPVSFVDRAGNRWNPKDPSVPEGPEFVTLRQGLARSLNNVTVRILPEIAGAPNTNRLNDLSVAARKIRDMAGSLGIDMSQSPAYPSIALGTSEVTLFELVSAYTTFANQGVHVEPVAVTRIEDKEGNVLAEYYPEYSEEVISPETAYLLVDMMRGVIRGGDGYHGTGVRLRNVYGVRQDVAGKTGTTQNSADNWFVAMMPHIVMGSWVGGEDRRIRFPKDNPMSIGQGARTALPIVGTFINYAQSDPEAPWSYEAFSPPPGFVMPEDPQIKETIIDEKRGTIGW